MASKEQRKVVVSADSGKQHTGVLNCTAYDSSERMKRALTMLFGCWLAAGVSVFIIIAHWVLVPGFLIAGPILAVGRYRQLEALENVECTCPQCSNKVIYPLEANDKLPKWTYCSSCDKGVKIELVDG